MHLSQCLAAIEIQRVWRGGVLRPRGVRQAIKKLLQRPRPRAIKKLLQRRRRASIRTKRSERAKNNSAKVMMKYQTHSEYKQEYDLKNKPESFRPKLDTKLYNKKKREEWKKYKKERDEHKKNTQGDPRAGLLGRRSTTRNAFIRTYSSTIITTITELELTKRNELLGVCDTICFWCKCKRATTLDHYVPSCCTKKHVYGQMNHLNGFPSCAHCNSPKRKGGNIPEVWHEKLLRLFPDVWTPDMICILNKWRNENKDKLYLPQKDIPYIKQSHNIINKLHKKMDSDVRNHRSLLVGLEELVKEYREAEEKNKSA